MVYVGEQILKSAASIAHDQLILPNLQYKWLCGIAIKKCDDSKATHILCDRKIFTARTEGRTTEWGGEHLIQLHVAHPFVLPRKDFYMIRSLINMNKGILKADTLPLLDVESYLDVFFKNCLEVYFAYANEVHLQRDNTEKILLDPSVQEWTDEDLIHKGKAVLDTFADLCPKFGPFEMVRNAAKARGVVLKYDAENATVK